MREGVVISAVLTQRKRARGEKSMYCGDGHVFIDMKPVHD